LNELATMCSCFPSLTTFSLFMTNESDKKQISYSLADLMPNLARLKYLVHLKLTIGSENFPTHSPSYSQLPSVQVFHLRLNMNSHHNLEQLHLQRTLPNLQ